MLAAGLWVLAASLGCRGPDRADRRANDVRAAVLSPELSLRTGCTPSGPERCFDATDDNCNGIIDEGCGLHTGLLQFTIAWDKPAADVDLEVTDPNGEVAEVQRLSRSGLVKDRDCPGRSNECQGQNLENVYLEGTETTRGSYWVRIRLEKLGESEPPVTVRLGARVGPKAFAAELTLRAPGDQKELRFDL